MNIQRNKNGKNSFTITDITFGKLLRLEKALELDQKETGSTLGAEMLQTVRDAIFAVNSTPIKLS